jgi:sialate O-acetylesterase
MTRFRNSLAPLLLFVLSGSLEAAVTLPRLLSDHMLLQRDMPVRVWGKANPEETVTVRFRGQSVLAKAGTDGRWEAFLMPLKAGGPSEMTVAGENTITIRDVLVGDVWVGSGQSNMVMSVERSNNAQQEIAAAKFPQIRLFKVTLKVADQPLDDVEGEWTVCSPETVPSFSAAGYFFARDLYQKLRVPMGVIQSAWGGTPAESWTSRGAMEADPALQYVLDNWQKTLANYPQAKARYEQRLQQWEKAGKQGRRPNPPPGPGHQYTPGGLYNAMIAPLVPYAIRGVIWYQGENNANRAEAYPYRRLFQTLILDWRGKWAEGRFPFLFVQLANYAKTGPTSEWPELRESQTMALNLRDTGMAVIIDIGEAQDIHPKNKQDVGKRLALAARAIAYGEKLVYSGPMFREVTPEGDKLRVWFNHMGTGLKVHGTSLKGFAVAGKDRRFVLAQARLDGNTVVVSSPQVPDPIAVRYAWADNPDCNLYNAEGLPASPFRSDDWPDAKMP